MHMDHEAASKLNLLEYILSDQASEPIDLPISLLQTITKDFSDDLQIGRGGFAAVYKKCRAVAVKKLFDSIDLDEVKYNQEVNCLMRAKHKNIVRFLGYCADTHGKVQDYEGKFVMADVRHRLLCFEYLPNGNLHQYITDASHGLEWRERYKILKGICQGLRHLHELRIVHLDLKPANILLDDNMVPKISDFGLSRCFDENQTRTITSRLYGSWGYLAPEFHSGVITFKMDIYSLGVIFTEILTGQKGPSPVDDVLQNWRNKFDMSSAETLLEQVKVCAEISIECMDPVPPKRPVIQSIIQRLEETERTDKSIISGMTSSVVPQVEDELQTALERLLAKQLTWKLAFKIPLRLPVYTFTDIEGANGSPLEIILVNAPAQQTLRVELVILNGDFPSDDREEWSYEEFRRSIVIMSGRDERPLLAGDVSLTMSSNNTAVVHKLYFTDNSANSHCKMLRIAACVMSGSFNGIRIQEAITQAFKVEDRHMHPIPTFNFKPPVADPGNDGRPSRDKRRYSKVTIPMKF